MIEIEIKGLEEQLEKFRRFEEIASKHLRASMLKSVTTLRSEIVPLTPVFLGRLRNSINSEVVDDGHLSIVGKVGSSLRSEIYPLVMEFGRKPGAKMPPPSALERWVHLQLGVSEKEALGVAFKVAWGIHRHGIKARHFMREGYNKSKDRIIGYFNDALKRITEEISLGN